MCNINSFPLIYTTLHISIKEQMFVSEDAYELPVITALSIKNIRC